MPEFSPVFNLSALNGANGFRIDATSDTDYIGTVAAFAGDVNGDGFDDIVIGDYMNGSAYVVFGRAGGFAPVLPLTAINGTNGFRIDGPENFGRGVSAAGDVNGDGLADFIVGSSYSEPDGIDRQGASYVVFGQQGGFGSALDVSSLNGTNGFRLDGVADDDRSGGRVAAAGDLNGDGVDDLVVVAALADPNGEPMAGSAYVVFGSTDGFASSLDLSALDGSSGFRIDGEAGSRFTGESIGPAGDVNGDGFADLVLGSRYADPDGTADAGAGYVVFGTSEGFPSALNVSELDGLNGFRLDGVAAGDRAGAVSGAGDIDGDGFDDLIVGASRAQPNGLFSGAAYVVFGHALFGTSVDLSSLNGANGFRIDGLNPSDSLGGRVHAAGDVNGDGFADIVIGASGFNNSNGVSNAGAAFVIFGKADGFSSAIDLANLDGDDGFRLEGVSESEFAGVNVVGAGDVNQDGFSDILVGANGTTQSGYSSGSLYVFFGHRAETAVGRVGTGRDEAINGGMGNDTVLGLGGNDSLRGWENDDRMTGGGGADTIVGGVGNDTLNGGTQNDTLYGITGNDRLAGETGADNLFGGLGNDTLIGGAGADGLNGGGDSDTFTFRSVTDSRIGMARDRIADFAQGSDIMDLAGIDANTTVAGNQAFAFIGAAAFTGAGQVRTAIVGNVTVVQMNVDADLTAESAILLLTPIALNASDFVL